MEIFLIEAARVTVISPMVDERANAVAKAFGIEVYGYAGDIRIKEK